MPSRKATEQCMTWLKSVAADKNSLDGINAELVLNVIAEQRERLDKLGAQFKKVKDSRDRLSEEINNYVNNDMQLTDEQEEYLRSQGIDIVHF